MAAANEFSGSSDPHTANLGNPLMRRLFDLNSAGSLVARARHRRWEQLYSEFPSFDDMSVVDLGGSVVSWSSAPMRPARLVVVNLNVQDAKVDGVETRQGDATDLPSSLFAESFDLVYSNSLLEHVGGHFQRYRVAENVRRLAERHWVQTPYRYFPIEPHWLFPGLQFLPYEARVQVSMRWRFGHMRATTRAEAEALVNEVELVSVSQMQNLFPESGILRERFLGLTKSLIAVRNGEGGR
ncbi:class I SAM-dependent methyltransferase [Actinomycetospora flava]|uniref:Class I SAM-dependent methyltransferase n=1 Tax=Actinomycetospora flava TaxID=3129232 RepID=A0ABU8M501_9PSEU